MKPNKLRLILPFAVLAIAVGVFVVMNANKKEPEKKAPDQNAPFVSVKTIELQPMTLEVKSQGLVAPKFETHLVAQVSGEITVVSDKFVRGGLVKKGELLAQIDPFDYDVKLQQAKANLASARASFILERAQGRVAEAEWKNITTAEPSELGLRKPQQEQALAAVKAAEAGLQQASKDLERTRIVAPYDALVSDRNISPGTFVNVGSQIGHVMDIEAAEVRLPVAGKELLFLEQSGLGAPVVLQADVEGQQLTWNAAIVRHEGVIDSTSRMIYLVASLDDPYNLQHQQHPMQLPFGTYVTASIEGRHLQAAASVPRALLRENRLALLEDSKLAFTEVEVVRHEGRNSIVTAGLKDGDLLITSSLQYPVEGMSLEANLNPEAATTQPLTTAEPKPESRELADQEG